jgi:hypothetical protein
MKIEEDSNEPFKMIEYKFEREISPSAQKVNASNERS